MSTNRNNLSHQSQPIISHENPESYSESPMWIGIGPRLQIRNLPVNNESETVVSHKFEILQSDIARWQHLIDYEPITYEGVSTDHNLLKGKINSLYQEAFLCTCNG